MPARNMKAMMIHCTAGENAAAEAFFVEKPPVARVVKAWLTASSTFMPARSRQMTMTRVSTQ